MTDNNQFNVLDMAKEIASASEVEVGDLFQKPKTDTHQEQQTQVAQEVPSGQKKKKDWVPDEALLEGMDEFKAPPVTYAKEEFKESEDEGLRNIADDNAMQDALEAMDELKRTAANIEEAKRRRGIKTLNIPEGQYHATITAAAGDTNFKRAQAALDEIFAEIEKTYPEFITEWADSEKNNPMNRGVEPPKFHENSGKIEEIPEAVVAENKEEIPAKDDNIVNFGNKAAEEIQNEEGEEVKVIIDKSQLPEIAWDSSDIDKIKKSRTVELNIVEKMDLEYSQIEEADDNAVDAILSSYQRKTNDIVSPLPASKYRATFTGLSYTEVIDLSNSQELNNIDGEWKKWSICFNHIRNQSIGPWEEYQWYKDPTTHKKIKLPITAAIPPGINPDIVTVVTKFEDFLMKTSYLDLEFMLWKILCATSMEQEIISIDCHAVNNGVKCDKSYDWIYSPSDLLMRDSIDLAVLEDMDKAASASTKEEIEDVYNSSMLRINNTAKLNTSGFHVVFGHVSAYEYLTSIYGEIKSLEDAEENDPTLASRGLTYTTLTAIKGFIIEQEDGRKTKITGTKNLIRAISMLDEIDWQTIAELVRIMIEPYQFRFALRDIVCPKCKNRSNIPIESMTRMLFIVARSLSSVNVTLKRT